MGKTVTYGTVDGPMMFLAVGFGTALLGASAVLSIAAATVAVLGCLVWYEYQSKRDTERTLLHEAAELAALLRSLSVAEKNDYRDQSRQVARWIDLPVEGSGVEFSVIEEAVNDPDLTITENPPRYALWIGQTQTGAFTPSLPSAFSNFLITRGGTGQFDLKPRVGKMDKMAVKNRRRRDRILRKFRKANEKGFAGSSAKEDSEV